MTEIGERVVAIRDGEQGNPQPGQRRKLFIYGEGIYIGDRLKPGVGLSVPQADYEAIEEMFTQDDAVPIREHRAVTFVIAAHALEGSNSTQAVEEVITRLEADRKRPMKERVEELYLASNQNPCIHLDSGDVVFGFQCWWGPADAVDHKFPESHFERVTVPVPEGNGRWD